MREFNRNYGLAILWWFVIIVIQITLPGLAGGKVSTNVTQTDLTRLSKAELVAETRTIMNRVTLLEQKAGQTEAAGYTVYSPAATGELWQLYNQAQYRFDFLNSGQISNSNKEFGGYLASADSAKNSYDSAQVRRAMDDIQSKIPGQFLKNYRIFLAPLALSGVSGQGGAGFSIIYALPDTFKATESDLRVTLYHELGHHVHMSYMPTQTINGKSLWREYLGFRGGNWQDPGKVNTTEWGKSSEETFAEDFRMIYGGNQPYFGDMTLGDPRTKPGMVKTFQQFITGLAKEPNEVTYQSPWFPQGQWFWLYQEWFIALLWLVTFMLGAAAYSHRRVVSIRRVRTGRAGLAH